MKITSITVSAGRTFNHPYENYSNFKPTLSLTADIDEFDDVEARVQELQRKAEIFLEEHKFELLRDLNLLHKRKVILGKIAFFSNAVKSKKNTLNNNETDKDSTMTEYFERTLKEAKDMLEELKGKLERIDETLLEFNLIGLIYLGKEAENEDDVPY